MGPLNAHELQKAIAHEAGGEDRYMFNNCCHLAVVHQVRLVRPSIFLRVRRKSLSPPMQVNHRMNSGIVRLLVPEQGFDLGLI